MENNYHLEICPNCGSTEFLNNYPNPGNNICIKCGHEPIKLKLKLIGYWEELPQKCPFCNIDNKQNDIVFENTLTIIYKCSNCGKLDGYIILESEYPSEPNDNQYDPLSVEIAQHEGKPIFSAIYHKTIKKERIRKLIEESKIQLGHIFQNKLPELIAAGIDPNIIEFVQIKIIKLVKNRARPFTKKQLSIVAAAVFSLLRESNFSSKTKHPCRKGITDVKLEKIFNITRKTIRKWRKALQEEYCF